MASTRSLSRCILSSSLGECRACLPLPILPIAPVKQYAARAAPFSSHVATLSSRLCARDNTQTASPYSDRRQHHRTFTTTHQPRHPSSTTDTPRSTSSTTPTSPSRQSTNTSTPPPSSRIRARRPSPSASPTPISATKLASHDRGPQSKEDTQTDFARMDVLGNTAAPATSVDVCAWDGFVLDSGLRVGEGDGVVLVGADAFVWRPWMGSTPGSGVGGVGVEEQRRGGKVLVHGSDMKGGKTEVERTGGCVNKKGQFEVGNEVWGIFKTLWPRPDLLIIGTGPSIRPLAPATRTHLQSLGLRIEVLDTRNAASQFNMLATERGVYEVAAALVPIGFGLKD